MKLTQEDYAKALDELPNVYPTGIRGVFGFWQHDGNWPIPRDGEKIPVYLVSQDTVTIDKSKAHQDYPMAIGDVATVDNPESWRGYVRIYQ